MMLAAGVDAITRDVVWAALQSIAEEGGTALRKTAYSQAVREGRDFSVALFDAEGQMVAQGDFSPGHLGSMPSLVGHVLREYPPEALAPGDAIVLNDLYMGSGHLPDFFMTTPVFHRERLVGFVVNCAHQVDVGGAVAGSQAVEGVTEFYQEGIRILPVKLWRGGRVNAEVMRLIRGNVRLPDIVEGDLKAMRNSGRVAERRLAELLDRYGTDTVLATWAEILAHSEREMRAAIRAVPPGRYEAEDFYDDCGRDTGPLRVFVTVVVEGDEVVVDFTGSSPQTASGMNAAFNYTLAYTWHTVKSALVQSSLPQNAGTMRPIRAYAPAGSLFNAQPPAAAGARAVMQQRIVDVILQALARAVPERVIAASSHWANPIFEGVDPGRRRRFVFYDIIVGGMGARPHADGAEAVCGSFNLENIPVEVNESNYPIVVERLELMQDSAGAGQFRGSCGLRKDIRFLGERGRVSNLSDRHRVPPPGLFGGGPGALGRTVLNPGTPGERDLHPKAIYPLEPGDVVSFQVSGSGGYGDPCARDPVLVGRDVALGYLSAERARAWYGVVVDPATKEVDVTATAALRARRGQGDRGFPGSPEGVEMSITGALPSEKWPLSRRCDTIGRFWGMHWSGLQLVILREKGERDLADFKYRILRRHQRAYFLEGVKKLGISLDLPPAVIAGRYHYFSNMIGGLRMEYVEEGPRKVWIRYLPPAWSYPGVSLFAVPSSVQRAMFAGWHPHNGPSLGCPRLGFVVTKVFQDGEPYDEGYFEEYDRDLALDERIQYRPVTISPDFDPARAPKLDPNVWTEERLHRARRNFARDYLADGIRTALEMYGVHGAADYLAQAARLSAVQFFEDFRETFEIKGTSARDFAQMCAYFGELAAEGPTVESRGSALVLRRTNKLFTDGDIVPEVYEALFEFARVGAKIFNPRVRVTLGAVPRRGETSEEWIIEDVKERTF